MTSGLALVRGKMGAVRERERGGGTSHLRESKVEQTMKIESIIKGEGGKGDESNGAVYLSLIRLHTNPSPLHLRVEGHKGRKPALPRPPVSSPTG